VILQSVLLGLASAIGFGESDFLAAVVGRRIGSFRTVWLSQLCGVAILTLLAATPLATMPDWDPVLLELYGVGLVGGLALLSLYHGLQLGPVALVAPIAGANVVVVVILAIVVLGESVPGLAIAGAVLSVLGVLLASVDLRQRRVTRGEGREGVIFGLLGMLGFGLVGFAVAAFSKDVGWFGIVYALRLGYASSLTVMAMAGFGRRQPADPITPSVMGTLVAIGALEALGLGAFAAGSEVGLASVTAAVSATHPVFTIAGGIAVLHERLPRLQWTGVALVVVGLVLLGLGA
jgi:drug/metabolite transporter (DMT)-like permease